VQAQAQCRVAGHGLGANELDVGRQGGGGAVDPARVDEAAQARRGGGGQHDGDRQHDAYFDRRDAVLVADLASGGGVCRLYLCSRG
jgi:hypothetical protein